MGAWKVNGDIAHYIGEDGFTMIVQIRLVDRCGDGIVAVETETIHMDKIDGSNMMVVARAMRELGEELQRVGYENLEVWRECEYCGSLFIPHRADAKYCNNKGRCKVSAHRLEKAIREGELDDFDDIFKFKGGKIDMSDLFFDKVVLGEDSAKVILYSTSDPDDEDLVEEVIRIRARLEEDEYYMSLCGDEGAFVYDRKGDTSFRTFLFALESFLRTHGEEEA